MTVIQVRGTSGSGKSTAVRRFMESWAPGWDSVWSPGRKQPFGYVAVGRPVAVLGHYESACGGCDTIGSARAVFDALGRLEPYSPQEKVVVCEGLLLSEDVKWTVALKETPLDVRVLFLTTPLGRCLDNIRTRRAAAGNTKELSEDNTRNRVATIERARLKLLDAGIMCRRASADQVPSILARWSGLHAVPGG